MEPEIRILLWPLMVIALWSYPTEADTERTHRNTNNTDNSVLNKFPIAKEHDFYCSHRLSNKLYTFRDLKGRERMKRKKEKRQSVWIFMVEA